MVSVSLIVLIFLIIILILLIIAFFFLTPTPNIPPDITNPFVISTTWSQPIPVSDTRGRCRQYTFSNNTPSTSLQIVDSIQPDNTTNLCTFPNQLILQKQTRTCLQSICTGINGQLFSQGETEILYTQCQSNSCLDQIPGSNFNFTFEQAVIGSGLGLTVDSGCLSAPNNAPIDYEIIRPVTCDANDLNQTFLISRASYPIDNPTRLTSDENGYIARFIHQPTGLCAFPPLPVLSSTSFVYLGPVILDECNSRSDGFVWGLIPPTIIGDGLTSVQQIIALPLDVNQYRNPQALLSLLQSSEAARPYSLAVEDSNGNFAYIKYVQDRNSATSLNVLAQYYNIYLFSQTIGTNPNMLPF